MISCKLDCGHAYLFAKALGEEKYEFLVFYCYWVEQNEQMKASGAWQKMWR